MRTYPEIGSKYEGPCYDRPALRKLPPGWVLEETLSDVPAPWWQRSERWVLVLIVLMLLLGAAQAVKV